MEEVKAYLDRLSRRAASHGYRIEAEKNKQGNESGLYRVVGSQAEPGVVPLQGMTLHNIEEWFNVHYPE